MCFSWVFSWSEALLRFDIVLDQWVSGGAGVDVGTGRRTFDTKGSHARGPHCGRPTALPTEDRRQAEP